GGAGDLEGLPELVHRDGAAEEVDLLRALDVEAGDLEVLGEVGLHGVVGVGVPVEAAAPPAPDGVGVDEDEVAVGLGRGGGLFHGAPLRRVGGDVGGGG